MIDNWKMVQKYLEAGVVPNAIINVEYGSVAGKGKNYEKKEKDDQVYQLYLAVKKNKAPQSRPAKPSNNKDKPKPSNNKDKPKPSDEYKCAQTGKALKFKAFNHDKKLKVGFCKATWKDMKDNWKLVKKYINNKIAGKARINVENGSVGAKG